MTDPAADRLLREWLALADESGRCSPSTAALSRKLGVTDRTVRRALSDLVAEGRVRVDRRGRGGNSYTLQGLGGKADIRKKADIERPKGGHFTGHPHVQFSAHLITAQGVTHEWGAYPVTVTVRRAPPPSNSYVARELEEMDRAAGNRPESGADPLPLRGRGGPDPRTDHPATSSRVRDLGAGLSAGQLLATQRERRDRWAQRFGTDANIGYDRAATRRMLGLPEEPGAHPLRDRSPDELARTSASERTRGRGRCGAHAGAIRQNETGKRGGEARGVHGET